MYNHALCHMSDVLVRRRVAGPCGVIYSIANKRIPAGACSYMQFMTASLMSSDVVVVKKRRQTVSDYTAGRY